MFDCNLCHATLGNFKSLRNHQIIVHQNQHSCSKCDQWFPDKKSYMIHSKLAHKVWKCHICNIKFIENTLYLLHINNLHDGRDKDLNICKDCGKTFSATSLKRHVQTNCDTLKTIKCKKCKKSFGLKLYLDKHMMNVHSKIDRRKWLCCFCGNLYVTKHNLEMHENSHIGVKPHKCQECGKSFVYAESLITHMSLHTGIKPYLCNICGASFSCWSNLIQHRRTNSKKCAKASFECNRPTHESFKIKLTLNKRGIYYKKQIKKEEMKKMLSEIVEKNQVDGKQIHERQTNHVKIDKNKIVVKYQFERLDDDNKFLNNDSYKLKKVKINLVFCDDFEKPPSAEFKLDIDQIVSSQTDHHSKDNLDSNQTNHQLINDVANIDDYSNDRCNSPPQTCYDQTNGAIDVNDVKFKCFVKLEKLNFEIENNSDHQIVNLSNKSRQKCPFCGVKRNLKFLLFHFYLKHAQNNQLETFLQCFNDKQQKVLNTYISFSFCKICNKGFCSKSELDSHQKIEHGIQKGQHFNKHCEKCFKKFKCQKLLDMHVSADCDEKKLNVCKICEKSFSNMFILKYHLDRVHLNKSKQFKCNVCSKQFSTKETMRRHHVKHTGKKPFKCKFCEKSFPYLSSLITHNSLHTGLKPYFCVVCGMQFSCTGNLRAHRLTNSQICGKKYLEMKKANPNLISYDKNALKINRTSDF